MDPILLLGSVGLPLVLGIGGLLAWRATRAQQERAEQPAVWRDDSLDDWRRERDARLERERAERAATHRDQPDDPTTESREGQVEKRTHTRLGG